MTPPEQLAELVEAVADGHTPDWDAAARGATTADERAAVATLRELAVVGRLFASSTSDGRGAWRDRTPLDPGTTWGGLRIEAHVGRGRFGDVYRAWDPALHRVVALKLIATDEASSRADSEVIEEGRLMARVRHPNVVAIHGAQRIGDVTGLSMEFIEGRTLEDELLASGAFSAEELRRVAGSLCGALAAVHAAGLIHRDVKARNVIRETGGRIVLGDFGTGLAADAMTTLRVGLVGTPVYIAPEIFQRGAATEKSDLYSLGVLLFRLSTGRFPVSGRSMVELRAAHESANRPILATLRPDLPQRLRTAIERLLDPEPDRRFATAVIAGQAIVPLTATRGRLPAIASLAAVATVVAASWGWWQWTVRDGGRQGPAPQQNASVVGGGQPPAPLPVPLAVPVPATSDLIAPTVTKAAAGGAQSTTSPSIVHLSPVLQSTHALSGVPFDGRLIACRDYDRGGTWICDLATGEVRLILAEAPPTVSILGRHSRLLSPDGLRIAGRVDEGPPGRRQAIVYVVGTGGTAPITLLRTTSEAAPYLHRWLADGSALLVSESAGDGRRAFLLPVNGTARKELYRMSPEHGDWFDLSPDGRFLAVTRQDREQRDLAVIDLATGTETRLLPGVWGFPIWVPDGRGIVFTIVRGSSSDLMRLPMLSGLASGPPELVWRFARADARLIGFSGDGSLFTNNRSAARTAYVAAVDLSRSHIGPAQLVDPGDAEDTVGADWSPDGSRIAYLRGLLGHLGGPAGTLVVRTVGGPIIREIPLPAWMPESAAQVRWSPDGRHLAVAYGGNTGRAITIEVIDLDTGKRQHVVAGVPYANPRWDPTGEWLYYQENSTIGKHRISTGESAQAYRAPGLTIVRDGGFDVSRTDGALAIIATRPGAPCVVRIVESTGSVIDRHVFTNPCRAAAWSHDGTRILVSMSPMSRQAPSVLWSLDRTGGDPTRLSNETHVIHDLSVGPKGDHLLFSAGNPPWVVVMVTGIQGARR